ncbi:sigma-70 family RNA polymerase sigma factor [Maridesulfovibrio sp.]|uniref:RNA polymerase sigma factor n=1 Tax=Maridesulfovibrio sp. TaxID=2795000 RepID=UPI0029C9C159|nr:sigma-70 family RNA polymerase sigma factor [Maridesulfovibrio sp.]
MNDERDLSVIKKVMDGDIQLFEVLVIKYQSSIYNLMLRIFRDEDEAADMAQEAFIKTYKKLNMFSGGNVFSWLYTLSLNVARDRLRSNKRNDDLFFIPENISDFPDTSDQITKMETTWEADKLYSVIEKLPLGYTEPLLLRFREELSLKEVAELTGLSLSGVKMRIHRGLAMVREILGESHEY